MNLLNTTWYRFDVWHQLSTGQTMKLKKDDFAEIEKENIFTLRSKHKTQNQPTPQTYGYGRSTTELCPSNTIYHGGNNE
jgi:hypothetical protein